MASKKSVTSSKSARPAAGKVVMNTTKVGSAIATFNFGAVSVRTSSPKVGELMRNVTIGQAALARAVPRLVKPGVSVKAVGSVPLFRADPENPARLIREVNGKVTTGSFVNGKFKVSSAKR